MAWIKMRTELWTHPKAVTVASRLSAPPAHVIGALHYLWCLADQHSTDGALSFVTPKMVDDMVDLPGFCEAVAGVGWLTIDGTTMTLPSYDRHNGPPAKARAQGQKRAQASRSRNGRVTVDRDQNRTEQNRTEEKKKALYSSAFERWWALYPRKAAKAEAAKAYERAVDKIRAAEGCDLAGARQRLQSAAEVFAVSDKAKGAYCPYPATWLNGGRYDDDPKAWEEKRDDGRKRDDGGYDPDAVDELGG